MIPGKLIKITDYDDADEESNWGDAPLHPIEGNSFRLFNTQYNTSIQTTTIEQTVKLDSGIVMFRTRNSTYVWVPGGKHESHS